MSEVAKKIVKQATKAVQKLAAAPAKKAAPVSNAVAEQKQINAAKRGKAPTKTPSNKIAAPARQPVKTAAPAPTVAAKKVVETTAKSYLPASERKTLLDKALGKVLKREGIAGVTRSNVATEAGVSNSLLRVYYTNAEGLKIAAVQLAVDAGDLKTAKKAIADGFDAKTLTRKAQKALKDAA